jgi:acyl carrier protein
MTSDPDVERHVRDIITAIARQELDNVGRDDDLVEALGVDSLQGLQILAAVEKQFDIRLPDDQLIRMRTVGAIADAVQQLRQRRAS